MGKICNCNDTVYCYLNVRTTAKPLKADLIVVQILNCSKVIATMAIDLMARTKMKTRIDCLSEVAISL